MKIGIATIHTDLNYGAVLQAYATEEFLNKAGYDSELIDYTNAHIQEQFQWSYKQYGKIFGYVISFVRNALFKRMHYYKQARKNVRSTCRFSKKVYRSRDDLCSVDYDILVAGSDQIWNPEITGELDPVYFLQFGNPIKRISLASSVGSTHFSAEQKEQIARYLQSFDCVSVRESFAKEQIQPCVNQDIKVLLDPTLLLTKSDWINSLARKSQFWAKRDRYILTYFVGGNKAIYKDAISEYSKKFELPVWSIQFSNYKWRETDKRILGASMEDFVALVANADLVITDSFHGVAFSVNLETSFVALANKANPVRVLALLKRLGVGDRIDMSASNYHEVDYQNVTPRLEALRADSVRWVLKAIES